MYRSSFSPILLTQPTQVIQHPLFMGRKLLILGKRF
jgi:hypothetical protein